MRYAIPVRDDRLDPHFGHCESFALIDVDPQERKILRKEVVPSPGHQPGFLPGWLAEQGANAVIAGGMGARAQQLFEQNRIEVIVGAPSVDPERVVMDHLMGVLVTGDNACDH